MNGKKSERCPACLGTGKKIDFKGKGQELKRRREKLGITGATIAWLMSISPDYLYLLESGKRPMSGPLVEKYENALATYK